jgi:hypothetical protein
MIDEDMGYKMGMDKYYRNMKDYYNIVNQTAPHKIHEMQGSLTHAVSYAQLAVKGGFVVNAGAILFLPIMIESGAISVDKAISVSVYFVIGMGLMALCCLAAYLNFIYDYEIKSSDIGIINRQLMNVYFGENDGYEVDEVEIEKLEKQRKLSSRIIFPTFIISILAGVGSYVIFYIGCYYLLLPNAQLW